jgi:hypothetical protein
MYCPKCRSEFREGFIECSDCHVPLQSGPPPDPPSLNSPPELPTGTPQDLELVAILECKDSIKLALAEGLLDDAGIPYFLSGRIWGLPTNSGSSEEIVGGLGLWQLAK